MSTKWWPYFVGAGNEGSEPHWLVKLLCHSHKDMTQESLHDWRIQSICFYYRKAATDNIWRANDVVHIWTPLMIKLSKPRCHRSGFYLFTNGIFRKWNGVPKLLPKWVAFRFLMWMVRKSSSSHRAQKKTSYIWKYYTQVHRLTALLFQSVFFPEDVQGACQRGQHSPLSPGNKPSRGYPSGAGRIGEVRGLCIRKLAGWFPEKLAGG